MLNYVQRVAVGREDAAANGGATLAAIERGDILILDEDMNVLSGTPGKQKFYVAQGTGHAESPFIMSSLINPDFAKTTNKDARAAADQVTTVSVETPAIGDSVNVIIAFKDRLRIITNRQTRMVLSHVAETTDAYDLASALAKQALYSSPYSDPYGVVVEVTSDGTESVTEAGNTIAVTKGSDQIVFSVAAEHGTDTAYVVGDKIRINGGTYEITGVSGTTVTIDRAYPLASASLANTAVAQLSSITAYNLKVTGVDSPYNNVEIDEYEKPVFTVGTDQSGATVTDVTAMDLGQGVARQIKKMEFDAQGYLGNTNLRQWPIPTFDFHANDARAYDVINIISQDEHEGDLQDQMKSPVGLTLAFSRGANGSTTTQRDAVDSILESVLGISALTWA